jgi:ParB family chromosome partitioning protein
MAPAPKAETQEEAEERQRSYEQQLKEYEREQERKAEEHRQQFEREQKEHEAERARREKLHKADVSRSDRILDKAPAMFSAAHLRMLPHALVNIDLKPSMTQPNSLLPTTRTTSTPQSRGRSIRHLAPS